MYISLELLRKQRDYLTCEIPNPDTEEIQGIVNMFDAILDAVEVNGERFVTLDFIKPEEKPLVVLFMMAEGERIHEDSENILETIKEFEDNSIPYRIHKSGGDVVELLALSSQFDTYIILSEENQKLIQAL